MLPHKSLRRADVVVSSLIISVGIGAIYAGSRMPWSTTLTGGDAQWYLSPGLFPTVVGSLLILFSLRTLATALKEGGHHGVLSAMRNWLIGLPRNRPIHRAVIISLLMTIYVLFGVGKINFIVASATFLFVSIAFFWWPQVNGRFVRAAAITLAVSMGVPFSLSYIFSTFLNVPMP